MATTKDYYKGLTIQFEGDDTKLADVLSNINKNLRSVSSAARQTDSALKLDPTNVNLLKDRTEQARKQVEIMTQRVKALKAGLAEAKDPEVITRLTEQADIAEVRLKNLREQLARISVESVIQGDTGLGAAVRQLGDLGEGLQNIGSKVAGVGDKLTMGLTTPIVAASTAAVGAAVTIDSALTDVRKTVDGTAEDYQKLHDAAIEFSKTNGVIAEQVLEVQALGAQLGYTIDELEMIGRVGTGLDLSTDMNAEQATTELAQFANITGMAHDQTENYASTIVALGNTTATAESKISSMAQHVAAAGSQVGMSEADILGLSAALSSMGIEAESGGTNISKIMSRIDKDVATSSATLADWAQAAGMSAEDFASKWREAPIEALEALFAGMGSTVEQGGNLSVILEELGIKSNQAVDVAKRLTNGHELLAQSIETANQAWQENTALTDEVANRNDSLAAKMQMLQNRVTAVLEEVGAPLADALTAALDAAEPLFEAIEDGAKTFAEMDESEQQAIVQAVAFAAAIGPVVSVVGRVTEGIGGLASSLSSGLKHVMDFQEAMTAGLGVMGSLEYASAGLATTLSASLVGVGIVAAIAGIAALADQVARLDQQQRNVRDATTGLTTAMDAADKAFDSYSEGADGATASLKDLRDATQEVIDKQAELARDMRDDWEKLGTDEAVLNKYVEQMDELSGKASLTADELATLKGAVDAFNETTGASISVVDEQTGKLSLTADQLREVAEAHNAAERAAQAQADKAKLLEEQVEIERQIEENAQNGATAIAREDAAMGAYLGTLSGAPTTTSNLTSANNNLEASLESNKAAIADLDATIAAAGYKFSTYEVAMAAAGVTGEQFASLTAQQLAEIDSVFDGTIDSIAAKLQSFGISVGGVGSAAVKGTQDATKSILDTLDSIPSGVSSAANKAISEQQRANSRALKAQQRANAAAEKALSKQLDAELDAVKKAHQAQLKEAKKAYEEQTKAHKAETERRIKQVDEEYEASVKALEDDPRIKAIDAQIAAINDQQEADKTAQRMREREEKTAELQSAVDSARSRRRKAEAQKALDDYLEELRQEDVENERKSLLQKLDDQKDAIEDEIDQRKDALKQERDDRVAQIEESRAAELEAQQAADDREYEQLQERLQAEEDAIKESNDNRLQAMRDAHQDQLDLMREQQQEQLDAMRGGASAAGAAAGAALADGLEGEGPAVEDATEKLKQRARLGFVKMPDEFGGVATSATKALNDEIDKGKTGAAKSAEAIVASATSTLGNMPGNAAKVGADTTIKLSSSLDAGRYTVQTAAQYLGQAQEAANRSADATWWGSDLANNLANGIYAAQSAVYNAASWIGQQIHNLLGHSVPKEGILHEGGRGEVVWGQHLVENIAKGMEGSEGRLTAASGRLALALNDGFDTKALGARSIKERERANRLWMDEMSNRYADTLHVMEEQTRRSMRNIAAIMRDGSGTLSARLDANVGYANTAARAASAVTVRSGDVNVTLELTVPPQGLQNTTNIRQTAKQLADEVGRQVAAKLG